MFKKQGIPLRKSGWKIEMHNNVPIFDIWDAFPITKAELFSGISVEILFIFSDRFFLISAKQ